MTLAAMRKAVFAQKPAFKRVLAEYGDLSLSTYFKALGANYTPLNVPKKRRQELISALCAQTAQSLDQKAAKAIKNYFKKRYTVSTAAHHDFATHPFFANYLITAGFANLDARLNTIPVLSCAGISLNNSSFPRGLLFHDKHLTNQRLTVVSLKNHHHPVYAYPGFTPASLPRTILPDLQPLIADILTKASRKHTALTDQITAAVRAMIKKIPGLANIEALYLAQEEAATILFLKHHLQEKTIMHRIVFDAHVRELFIKEFNGIIGAHDTQRHAGSHLFWALTSSGRVGLRVHNRKLVSSDGKISIALTPPTIRKALREKKLMPTMSFTLTLVSFYYGLACAGGFSQVGYLAEMKAAYLKLLAQLPGTEIERTIANAVPTNLFSGEFVLATLGNKKVAATPIDIVLNRTAFTETALRRLMEQTTLAEAVDRIMPDLYKIIAPRPLHDR